MILIWRGWGLLAVVMLFPILASCAGLPLVEPQWAFPASLVASLILAGVVCVHFGTRWNRRAVDTRRTSSRSRGGVGTAVRS